MRADACLFERASFSSSSLGQYWDLTCRFQIQDLLADCNSWSARGICVCGEDAIRQILDGKMAIRGDRHPGGRHTVPLTPFVSLTASGEHEFHDQILPCPIVANYAPGGLLRDSGICDQHLSAYNCVKTIVADTGVL